jgi:hypothetical protein
MEGGIPLPLLFVVVLSCGAVIATTAVEHQPPPESVGLGTLLLLIYHLSDRTPERSVYHG